jgi:hypothetical protein
MRNTWNPLAGAATTPYDERDSWRTAAESSGCAADMERERERERDESSCLLC